MRDPNDFFNALDRTLVRVEDDEQVLKHLHPANYARFMRHVEWWQSLPWWHYRKLWARVTRLLRREDG